MAQAVNAEKPHLQNWWLEREKILALLEDHLYSGTPIDDGQLRALGEKFSVLNAMVAIYEAKAFAALEDHHRHNLSNWETGGKTRSQGIQEKATK